MESLEHLAKPINASAVVGTGKLDRAASEWTGSSLHRAFLRSGFAIVRGVVPLTLLKEVECEIVRAYAKTKEIHVYDRDLLVTTGGRISGFELVDLPLLNDLLARIYDGQHWRKLDVTARRIEGSKDDQGWQQPLELHLDSQFHPFQFTTNFWLPFQDCGVDSPCLQLVPLDYLQTRQYSGYTGSPLREGEDRHTGYFPQGIFDLAEVTRKLGGECLFRPVMHPGDLIVASNWLIHGSYRTEKMAKGRTSAEIRFVGEHLNVKPPLNE
jgi:hypothetical protein